MALPDYVLGLRIGETIPKEVDHALMDAIQAVEVNQSDDDGLGFQQGFQITFAAQRSADQRPEYALLQNPLLQPGNRLIVTVTLQAKPRVLIDGIITHQQLTFSSGNGDASIAIMGLDLSILLDLPVRALRVEGNVEPLLGNVNADKGLRLCAGRGGEVCRGSRGSWGSWGCRRSRQR